MRPKVVIALTIISLSILTLVTFVCSVSWILWESAHTWLGKAVALAIVFTLPAALSIDWAVKVIAPKTTKL